MPVHVSKTKRIVLGNQIDKLGCAWNYRRRTFEITCGSDGGPTLELSPPELIELGVELVLEGNKAMTERRWQ